MDDCPAGIVESLSIRNGQLIEDRHRISGDIRLLGCDALATIRAGVLEYIQFKRTIYSDIVTGVGQC